MALFKLEDGTEVEAFTSEEMDAKIAEATSGLEKNRDKILKEKKETADRLKALEDEVAKRKQDDDDKKTQQQKEQGEFKKLYETEAEKNAKLQGDFDSFKQGYIGEKIGFEASKIAAELTKDTARGKVLADYAAKYIKYNEESGISYGIGDSPAKVEDIKKVLESEYPFLVDGNQSSGGGANGNKNPGKGGQNRSKMTADERKAYIKEHGQEAFLKLPK